jgi:hypothetical protein
MVFEKIAIANYVDLFKDNWLLSVFWSVFVFRNVMNNFAIGCVYQIYCTHGRERHDTALYRHL